MAQRESPADRRRYVLYFRGHRPPDEHRRVWVPIFWDPAIAHGVIQKALGANDYTRAGNTLMLTGIDLNVTCEYLDEVLNAAPTAITDENARIALRFKLGSWEEDHSKKDEVIETVTETGETTVTVKPAKPPKPVKAEIPAGWVTAGELAKRWGMDPPKLRAFLRASDFKQHNNAWVFDPKLVPEIAKFCGVKKP